MKVAEKEVFGFMGSCFAEYFSKIFSYLAAYYARTHYPAYLEELEGIAEVIHDWVPQLDYRMLLMINMGYDTIAGCSSGVLEGGSLHGCPIHIRSMDWDMDVLRNLTIQATFVKGGNEVFKATTWVGFSGILTGINIGENPFSISINYREKNTSRINNLISTFYNGWPIGFLIRNILENCENYEEAVDLLMSSPLLAPVYMIVAGPNVGEGLVITRDRHKVDDVLDIEKCVETTKSVIQTNLEHWKDKDDIPKSTTDVLILNSVTRSCNLRQSFNTTDWNEGDNLEKVVEKSYSTLRTEEVLNYQTIYHTIMIPNQRYISSKIVYKE